MTHQLKTVKTESHVKLLDLQKANASLVDLEFESKKLEKENAFLKNRVEALEL